jgi:lipopolysaccharide export LptBFGC system permease protein LptF
MAMQSGSNSRLRARYEADFPQRERLRAFWVSAVGFCLCAAAALTIALEARDLAESAQSLPQAAAAGALAEAARSLSRALIVIAGGLILLGVGNYSSRRRSRRLATLLFCIFAIALCTDAVAFQKLAASPRPNAEIGLVLAAIDVPFAICAGVVFWLIAKMRSQERSAVRGRVP